VCQALRRDNGKTSTIDGDSKAVTQGADGIVTTTAIGDDHNGAQEQNDPSLTGLAYGLVPDRFDFATTRFSAYVTVTTFRPSSFSTCRAILSLNLAPQVK